MPEQKHTPGPWGAKPAFADNPQWTVETREAFICQTLSGNDEANARLIAAAPELLEACKDLLYVPDVIANAPGVTIGEIRRDAEIKARAAIVKAEQRKNDRGKAM